MSDHFPEYRQHPVDRFVLHNFAITCYQPYVPLAVDEGWYGKTCFGLFVLGQNVDKAVVVDAIRAAIKSGEIDVSDPQFHWPEWML